MSHLKGGNRKSQTISIDTYIAIALFLTSIVLFYYFIGVKSYEDNLDKDKKITGDRIREDELLGDGVLTSVEEEKLVEMTCQDFKNLFGTTEEICIYLRDADGKVVPLANGTHVKYGVGCPGMLIDGVVCGNNIT